MILDICAHKLNKPKNIVHLRVHKIDLVGDSASSSENEQLKLI